MSAKTKSKKNNGKNKKGIRNNLLIINAVIGAALLFIYLYAAFYYKDHFYNNTVINGINTTNMTVSEAEEAINSKVKVYFLTLDERMNIKDAISSEDINLHTEFKEYVSDLLKNQNAFAWMGALFKTKEYEVSTMLEYDKTLLQQTFEKLHCFDEVNIREPLNASISEYGEMGYVIVPEDQGAKIKKDKLYEAVSKAIDSLEASLSIEEAGCYEKPEITSKYPDLLSALEEMNRIAGANITYEFGKNTEILDGTKISKWISVDDNFKVTFDANGVKEFVDYIGKNYNSFGKVRTFTTSYKKEIKVSGGDYGWWLNRPEEVKELTEMVQNGEKGKRDPVYFQTAQQYGNDDIGDTYVEINLTAQHLFFYKDGKLILESDVVTGNVSRDLGTPVGTYPVQYKENDATLVGEDYETPVKYWMPFNKNIGMHDATWRAEFGKDIYLTKGSHGCINMPPASAKKMFQYMKRGVAVVVYELPGTENYDIEEKIKPNTDEDQNINNENVEEVTD